MTKRDIMIKAHKIARQTVDQVGDYMVALKLALKTAWGEVKMDMEQKLIGMGGKLWEGGSHRRVYLNNWLELAGVEVSRYKTGNISGASINGKHLSNAKAGELTGVKVFWDCNKEALVFQGDARALDDVRPMLIESLGI